jgi:hypothetical protein
VFTVFSNRGSVIRNGLAGECGAALVRAKRRCGPSFVRVKRRICDEKLDATSGFMLRLEIGMRRVLLGLGGILNAGVLRLEIWRSVQLEAGEVRSSVLSRIQILARRARCATRAVGAVGARSFASCMFVAPCAGAAAPTQSGDA